MSLEGGAVGAGRGAGGSAVGRGRARRVSAGRLLLLLLGELGDLDGLLDSFEIETSYASTRGRSAVGGGRGRVAG